MESKSRPSACSRSQKLLSCCRFTGAVYMVDVHSSTFPFLSSWMSKEEKRTEINRNKILYFSSKCGRGQLEPLEIEVCESRQSKTRRQWEKLVLFGGVSTSFQGVGWFFTETRPSRFWLLMLGGSKTTPAVVESH